jgi:hypothetical protein
MGLLKINKITKWYEKLVEKRKKPEIINPHTKLFAKRKELKSLEYYINKIKKPVGGEK